MKTQQSTIKQMMRSFQISRQGMILKRYDLKIKDIAINGVRVAGRKNSSSSVSKSIRREKSKQLTLKVLFPSKSVEQRQRCNLFRNDTIKGILNLKVIQSREEKEFRLSRPSLIRQQVLTQGQPSKKFDTLMRKTRHKKYQFLSKSFYNSTKGSLSLDRRVRNHSAQKYAESQRYCLDNNVLPKKSIESQKMHQIPNGLNDLIIYHNENPLNFKITHMSNRANRYQSMNCGTQPTQFQFQKDQYKQRENTKIYLPNQFKKEQKEQRRGLKKLASRNMGQNMIDLKRGSDQLGEK